MGLKIAVVGGGSTYTPELVEGFEVGRDRMPIDELVLLDTDPERLRVVGGLARRMLDVRDWTGRLTCTGDRDAALDGADFVLIQLRVGGQAARLVDETLPPTFGVIGQETTGAGGFAKALRTVPLVLELAEITARRRARRLDRRLHEPGGDRQPGPHRCGPSGHRPVQRGDQRPARDGRAVRRDAGPGPLEHVGLNHLTWERAILVDGVDRLPELIESDAGGAGRHRGDARRGRSSIRGDPVLLPALLLPDPKVVEDQRAGHTRAAGGHRHRARAARDVRGPGACREAGPARDRGGAFYSEAAAQLIASLHDGAGDVQVVDVRNDGALPDLPDALWWRSRPGSIATAPIPCRSRRSRPRCAGWSRP